MSKKKKNVSDAANLTLEVNRKIRGDWGAINPVTKVVPNKKKNQKEKHKGRMYDYD